MTQKAKERLEGISKLINTGRWDQALEQARVASREHDLALHARTWFLLALIEGLHGTATGRQAARRKAMQCDDYSEELEGDLLRDDAIAFLKNSDPEAAQECVDRAEVFHRYDQNRMICLSMVRGRIQLHTKYYDEAYQTLRNAAERWRKMGRGAHKQWRANLQLHLLMAAVMSCHRLKAWLLLPRLLWLDRNRRRWLVALACLSSKRICISVLHRY